MFKSSVFAGLLLTFVSLPAAAQDIATRILNIENRLRDLTGQMEELNYSMQQLQKQLANGQKQGGLQQAAPQPKTLAANEGLETIEDAPIVAKPKQRAIVLGDEPIETQDLATTQPVVPEATQDVVEVTAPAQDVVISGGQQDGVENVSLTPSVDTPESLYEKHYETLLRRQFGEAEAGFRQFLEKYPEHSLAGSAQYQLGETFYAQANYQEAARNFLQGYKNYPKSRRAPDSLLKLGLSLRKLDQQEQACAALASVSTEFPRAVEAKKRAQAELKRAGC